MVGFNIAEFSARINDRGTLQTNKFLVQINNPFQINNDLQFRASNISMPGVSLKYISTYRYGMGPEQKTPINVSFTDLSITFIEDKQNSIWKFFTTWIDSIFKFQPGTNGTTVAGTTYLSLYKDDYISQVMKILIFDNNGNNVNTINLTQAYPISIGNIELSWAEKSELMKVTVGFTFREWYFDGRPNIATAEASVTPAQQTNQVVPTPNPAAPVPPAAPGPASAVSSRTTSRATPGPQILPMQGFGDVVPIFTAQTFE
jgi:hypothetical protein